MVAVAGKQFRRPMLGVEAATNPDSAPPPSSKRSRKSDAGAPVAEPAAAAGSSAPTAGQGCGVPTVVCVRKAELRKRGIADMEEWLARPDTEYVGRRNQYVKGTFQSKWANKFPVKKFGREGCIAKYEEWLRGSPELLAQLPELAGKELGCWCKPEACHGDVLVALGHAFGFCPPWAQTWAC